MQDPLAGRAAAERRLCRGRLPEHHGGGAGTLPDRLHLGQLQRGLRKALEVQPVEFLAVSPKLILKNLDPQGVLSPRFPQCSVAQGWTRQ